MGALREGLSNFVNKIKSIFGRKKITEEKSAALMDTLTTPEPGHTTSGYPYIQGENPIPTQSTEIPIETQDTHKPEPTPMAA